MTEAAGGDIDRVAVEALGAAGDVVQRVAGEVVGVGANPEFVGERGDA
ncbi:MAG: hypothetical protein R6U94_11450 [Nitriliruptoraceae bacterium]